MFSYIGKTHNTAFVVVFLSVVLLIRIVVVVVPFVITVFDIIYATLFDSSVAVTLYPLFYVLICNRNDSISWDWCLLVLLFFAVVNLSIWGPLRPEKLVFSTIT